MSTLIQSFGIFSEIFSFLLPFLLVFAVLYALLLKTKFLTEDSNINAMISLAVALIFVASGAGEFIFALAPLMTGFFIVIFFTLMMFLFFGVKIEDAMKSKAVIIVIVSMCFIFIFYVVGDLYGGAITPGAVVEDENATNVTVVASDPCDYERVTGGAAISCMLSEPKFMGTIVLLGLLAAATFFVVYVPKG